MGKLLLLLIFHGKDCFSDLQQVAYWRKKINLRPGIDWSLFKFMGEKCNYPELLCHLNQTEKNIHNHLFLFLDNFCIFKHEAEGKISLSNLLRQKRNINKVTMDFSWWLSELSTFIMRYWKKILLEYTAHLDSKTHKIR